MLKYFTPEQKRIRREWRLRNAGEKSEEELASVLESLKQAFIQMAEVFRIEKIKETKKKVCCPFCGHPVNAVQAEDASCRGVFFKCKNRNCRKEFELKI